MGGRVLVWSALFARATHIETLARRAGFEAVAAAREEDALAAGGADWPDVVVLDGAVPGSTALDLCRSLRHVGAGAALLVLVGEPAIRSLQAFAAGADDCLRGPEESTLSCRLRSLAEAGSLRREVAHWRASGGLTESRGDADRQDRPRVLVLDPDGRSRERLAQILHPGFEVLATAEPGAALSGTVQGAYDLALIGLDPDDGSAAFLNRQMLAMPGGRGLRSLLVTDREDLPADMVAEAGFDDVIPRPVERAAVLGRLRLARRKQDMLAELEALSRGKAAGSVHRLGARPRPPPPERFAA
jgi:DNA-binding response OmpR family regulator